MKARLLDEGDRAEVEALLELMVDNSMFLLGNLNVAGLVDGPGYGQGCWAGAFDGARLVGLAAHFWNGILILQAPEGLDAAVQAAVAGSGRQLAGFVGPSEQVEAARQLLGHAHRPGSFDSNEVLYSLGLDALRRPAALDALEVCLARDEDLPLLAAWRSAYHAETFGKEVSLEEAEAQLRARRDALYVALLDGTPVSMTSFNAVLPRCVQVGGVYTPPERRGQGFARAAVAGSLLDAASRGVERGVLFTGPENVPARRAYEALGFEHIGSYHLLIY